MVVGLNKIKGFDITEHEKSKRIIEINIDDDILKKEKQFHLEIPKALLREIPILTGVLKYSIKKKKNLI